MRTIDNGIEDLVVASLSFLAGAALVLAPWYFGFTAEAYATWSAWVCGTAVAERRSIIVPDVDAFPGHIACDAASRSELVVPLFEGDAILGVLDLDAPIVARFDEADQAGLQAAVALFVRSSDLAAIPRI